jgi:AcrR family transcriptional regulator
MTSGLSAGDLVDVAPLHAALELDGPPGPGMDRYLDALVRCIARYGIGRVSVQDVARDLGVDRTTVYRQVGPIRRQVRLLAAREIGRAFALLPPLDRPVGVDDIVTSMANIADLARSHPVVQRVQTDDSDQITLGDVARVTQTLSAAGAAVAPRLQLAMDAGWIARRDPTVLATWLVSTLVWLVLMAPDADARMVLGEILGSVLTPAGDGDQAAASRARPSGRPEHSTTDSRTEPSTTVR